MTNPKLFSLTEAERLRLQLEPVLIEAMELRRKLGELDEQLGAVAEKIQRSGGLLVNYEQTARVRLERNRQEESLRTALERIHSTGCIVKDLDIGLTRFSLAPEQRRRLSLLAPGRRSHPFLSPTGRRLRRHASPSTRATPIYQNPIQ